MRRYLLLAIAATLISGTSALAAETGAGCGVGKMLWEGEKGILFQTLAWSTNGTFTNTFAMTAGTSGCDADAVILKDKEQEVFVAANLEPLSQEMAQGRGHLVTVMARLFGCDAGVQADFARMGQERYDAIFTADAATMDVLTNVRREVAANPVLAGGCTRIS